MNTFTSPLTNVLIGSLDSTADEQELRAAFEAVGGDASNLDLLTDADDVLQQLLTARGGSPLARLTRRLSLALDDTADRRIDRVQRELSSGHRVVVLHGVERWSVAAMAGHMRSLGASDLRYSGGWTSTDHGTSVAAFSA